MLRNRNKRGYILQDGNVEAFLRRPRPGLSVSLIVGENGAGKSTFLRDLAYRLRRSAQVIAISNTIYDRFSNMRGIERISAGSGRQLPARILKEAIHVAAGDGIVRLRTIGNTLEYCGYQSQIGLKINYGRMQFVQSGPDSNRNRRYFEEQLFENIQNNRQYTEQGRPSLDQLQSILPLLFDLEMLGKDGVIWLDFAGTALESSVSEQFSKVLGLEDVLRAAGAIDRIQLFIKRQDGITIPLDDASSGQLTLIASFAFISVVAKENSVLLIDEPENSLHPRWQREYIERLLALIGYRQCTIVIATHAPILLSGAQMHSDPTVDVYRLAEGIVEISDRKRLLGGKESLEETMFEAFGTVTPANHFVTESLSSEFARIRDGSTTAAELSVLVNEMKHGSFDRQQLDFLDGIIALAQQVEQARRNLNPNG